MAVLVSDILSAFAAPVACTFVSNALILTILLADPFAEDTSSTKAKKGGENKEYVHVRVQQRNGKKSLTTVQGLPEAFDYKKILKALKKGRFNFVLPG